MSGLHKTQPLHTSKVLWNTWMICGIASSILYVLTDISASLLWKEYSYFSQGFSELLSFQAPTRPFVLAASFLYNALLIAFGIGIIVRGQGKRFQQLSGVMLVGNAIIGVVTPLFFPAPMRGLEATAQNLLHVPLTGVEVLFILLSVCFGAPVGKGRFRLYSVVTVMTLILFGLWGGSFIAMLEENKPTPWLGIIERCNIYGYLLWVLVYAVMLLRSQRGIKPTNGMRDQPPP